MSVRVSAAGALTTVQDLGRHGWAHLGVPRAGALDAAAAALANRLVGNPREAAVLETTMTGVGLVLQRSSVVAVTGAGCEVRVGGRPVPLDQAVPVPAGASLLVGPALDGARSYVALSGGLDVPPVLGSRSTDTLAWLGPAPLAAGDVLPLGAVVGDPAPVDVSRRAPRRGVVRLHPGPRADWVGDLSRLEGLRYRVSADSNRIGLRLEGPPLPRARTGELASEGLVLGAVQLPPSGQPVVFLHDHPVTGGYPVVAVVDPADLGECAQARPGDELRLTLA
jgi:biotin-dependent carboxylase-like uncharacterized protein